jgi:hypothetical protein
VNNIVSVFPLSGIDKACIINVEVNMDDKKPEIREKKIRLVWGPNENTPVSYANHIQVSHAGETEFHITFGHLSPPLTVGLEEDELPDQVFIKPLITIVTSPDVMRAFVKVLSDNLKNFENKIQDRKEDED